MNKKILSILSILLPGLATAQASGGSFIETYFLEIILGLAVTVAVIALLVLIVTLNVVRTLLAAQAEEEGAEAPVEEAVPGAVEKLWVSVNDFRPIEEESDVMTDHEYDGIRELDNNLPPWWKWLFYASIGFAVVYLLYFHVLGIGLSSSESYVAEMQQAEEDKAAYQAYLAANADAIDVPTEGPQAIAAGQSTYIKFCAACHGNEGQGGIGPNFADNYWIHGGDKSAIVATIENGVPSKGMIPWKNQLSPAEIQQVTAFIISLEGTSPPNQKEPQGELFEREVEETEEAETGEPVALNE